MNQQSFSSFSPSTQHSFWWTNFLFSFNPFLPTDQEVAHVRQEDRPFAAQEVVRQADRVPNRAKYKTAKSAFNKNNTFLF